MATTTPHEFAGKPEITQDLVDEMIELYKRALGDEDKATDAEDHQYYAGVRITLEGVLNAMHGNPLNYQYNLTSFVDL